MSQRSVSAVDIILETNDNQFIKCELKRHLSPKTVGQITRALPLHGNAHFLGKSAVYFETSTESGNCTGFFTLLDMVIFIKLGNKTQDFSTLTLLSCVSITHNTLRG